MSNSSLSSKISVGVFDTQQLKGFIQIKGLFPAIANINALLFLRQACFQWLEAGQTNDVVVFIIESDKLIVLDRYQLISIAQNYHKPINKSMVALPDLKNLREKKFESWMPLTSFLQEGGLIVFVHQNTYRVGVVLQISLTSITLTDLCDPDGGNTPLSIPISDYKCVIQKGDRINFKKVLKHYQGGGGILGKNSTKFHSLSRRSHPFEWSPTHANESADNSRVSGERDTELLDTNSQEDQGRIPNVIDADSRPDSGTHTINTPAVTPEPVNAAVQNTEERREMDSDLQSVSTNTLEDYERAPNFAEIDSRPESAKDTNPGLDQETYANDTTSKKSSGLNVYRLLERHCEERVPGMLDLSSLRLLSNQSTSKINRNPNGLNVYRPLGKQCKTRIPGMYEYASSIVQSNSANKTYPNGLDVIKSLGKQCKERVPGMYDASSIVQSNSANKPYPNGLDVIKSLGKQCKERVPGMYDASSIVQSNSANKPYPNGLDVIKSLGKQCKERVPGVYNAGKSSHNQSNGTNKPYPNGLDVIKSLGKQCKERIPGIFEPESTTSSNVSIDDKILAELKSVSERNDAAVFIVQIECRKAYLIHKRSGESEIKYAPVVYRNTNSSWTRIFKYYNMV